ncbi:MAG: HdeD family acid-resistance protein [Alkalinema sp. RU_4_3]|nr:HdeD family acid-resistance protein [Alkalinema sp. RU_4_3]
MTTNSTMEYQPKPNQAKNMGLGVSILAIVLGIAAILLPSFSTLVVESWLAFILISVGTGNTFYAIKNRPEGFGWQIFLGILYIGTGILLFVSPLGGALTLTLLLGSFFLTEGVFESIMAFKLRPQKNWGWVLANGIITLSLGLLVWLGWPQDAFWTIGTLVGVSVLSTGISRLMLSRHATTTPMPPILPDDSI